jgi:hypothetical protein
LGEPAEVEIELVSSAGQSLGEPGGNGPFGGIPRFGGGALEGGGSDRVCSDVLHGLARKGDPAAEDDQADGQDQNRGDHHRFDGSRAALAAAIHVTRSTGAMAV